MRDFKVLPVLNHMAKYLIVSNRPVTDSMAMKLIQNGILNVATVYLNQKSLVEARIFNNFKMKTTILKIQSNQDLSVILFPDKLKDLNGYKHYLIQRPDITFVKGQNLNTMEYLLNTSASLQNATVEKVITDDLLIYRNMTLSMNKVAMNMNFKQVLNYEISAFCTIIPIVTENRLFYGTFFKPFDKYSKICYISLLLMMFFVWRGFKVKSSYHSILN